MTLPAELLMARSRWLTETELLAGMHRAHGLDEDAAELLRLFDQMAAMFLTTPQRYSQTRRVPALTVIDGGGE